MPTSWKHDNDNIKFCALNLVENKANILFISNSGYFLFIRTGENVYFISVFCWKTSTSKSRADDIEAAVEWMFLNTDCTVIDYRVNSNNIDMCELAEMAGFSMEFTRPIEILLCVYNLLLSSWLRDNLFTVESGNFFIEKLKKEIIEKSQRETVIDISPPFPKYAGAFVEMIYGGFPEKAVAIYNRFAQLGEFQQFSMISRDPLLFDIGVAVLQFFPEKRDFKVLKCK